MPWYSCLIVAVVLSATFEPGQVLAGKYRVERVLGQGGMGVVVAARHIKLDDRVAIKFLLPESASSGEAVARFDREARAAAKIKSEHVARVSDVGALDGGAPYMVMEYLEGRNLSDLRRESASLPIEDVLDYVLQACEAIAEAHSLGIVHRDLKPENLFLVRRADGSPLVKVLDFGISKMTGSGPAAAMTSTRAIMGSPLYMSPEQLASARDVDMRTDIWSLGIILYELLTGHPPFTADSLPQLCMVIVHEPCGMPRNLRADIPAGLQEVVLHCLEKDADKRFQNVGELATALAPFAPRQSRVSIERVSRLMRAAGLSATAAALPPSSGEVPPPESATSAAWGRTRAGKGASGKWGVLAGAVALGAAGVWLALRPAANVAEATGSAPTKPEAAPSGGAAVHASLAPVVEPAPASSSPDEQPKQVASALPAVSAAPPLPKTSPPRPAAVPGTDKRGVTAAPKPQRPVAAPPSPAKEFDFGAR